MQDKTTNLITLKDGRTLCYAEYGDPKGKPFFFFHGMPCSRFQAEILDKAAKELRVRIISPDRPGYGLSTSKKNRTLLDWSTDVIALADSLRIKKFAVVGNSGGGPYVAACAYTMSQRITRAGIVVGLGPTDIPGAFKGIAFINKLAWRSYKLLPSVSMQFTSFLTYITTQIAIEDTLLRIRSRADKKVIRENNLEAEIKRNTKEAFRQGTRGMFEDLQAYQRDWGFRLQDITTEISLWYGGIDTLVSVEMGKHYATQIPNSKLVIYPQEGHTVIINHAEEILRTLCQ